MRSTNSAVSLNGADSTGCSVAIAHCHGEAPLTQNDKELQVCHWAKGSSATETMKLHIALLGNLSFFLSLVANDKQEAHFIHRSHLFSSAGRRLHVSLSLSSQLSKDVIDFRDESVEASSGMRNSGGIPRRIISMLVPQRHAYTHRVPKAHQILM